MVMTEEELIQLQQIAAAQQANPNNPYLNRSVMPAAAPNSSSSSTPPPATKPPATQEELDRAAGIRYPGDEGYGGKGSPALDAKYAKPPSSITYDPNSPAPKDYVAPDPTAQGTTAAVGVRQAVPGAIPRLAGGSGGGGGTPAISPERENQAAHAASNERAEGVLSSQQKTVDEQQHLMKIGEEAAADRSTYREATLQLDQTKYNLDKYQADSQAKERSRLLDQEANEVRSLKVDPAHWFKERGTAGSILAAISMAAGAFAAAMPHTNSKENFAMKIIDSSIARDIDAQKDNIANKWKALNYQGDKNEKEYVHAQFEMTQKRDMMYKAYDHAGSMITEARNRTNNQVAILNLDKTRNELEIKKEDYRLQTADQMLQVKQRERAAAAAAAANAPDVKLGKDYDAYLKKVAEENASHPDKTSKAMSRAEYVAYRTDGGGGGASGGGKDEVSAHESNTDFKGMLNDPVLDKIGIVAGAFGDHSPRLAPDSAKITTEVKGLNLKGMEIIGKVLKETEGRISPVIVEELKKFEIKPGDTKELAQDKIRALQSTTQAAYRQAGVTGPSVAREGVPGAVVRK